MKYEFIINKGFRKGKTITRIFDQAKILVYELNRPPDPLFGKFFPGGLAQILHLLKKTYTDLTNSDKCLQVSTPLKFKISGQNLEIIFDYAVLKEYCKESYRYQGSVYASKPDEQVIAVIQPVN